VHGAHPKRAHLEFLSFIQQKIELPPINREVRAQVVYIAKDFLHLTDLASRRRSGSKAFLEERHRRDMVRMRVGNDHIGLQDSFYRYISPRHRQT
jgi:hypothetical protein